MSLLGGEQLEVLLDPLGPGEHVIALRDLPRAFEEDGIGGAVPGEVPAPNQRDGDGTIAAGAVVNRGRQAVLAAWLERLELVQKAIGDLTREPLPEVELHAPRNRVERAQPVPSVITSLAM